MHMKRLFELTTLLLLFTVLVFCSCKKDKNCEVCNNSNMPPVANAGPDQVIVLPIDTTLLDGSASNDPDGLIKEWVWKNISGPTSFNIIYANSSRTSLKNLTTGVYKFELTVKDNAGLSGKDTVQITVTDLFQPNRPPVANAGSDLTITLPASSVTMDGTASTDPDNNITSYKWAKISGPDSFNITKANSVQAQATNLAEGVYQFELTVTDSMGLADRDTTTVTVIKLYTNDIIFNDQVWGFNYTSFIIIPDLYTHLPAGVSFKVFMKRDNTNTWLEVLQSGSHDFVFFIDNADLLILSLTGSKETDTPDIKIVY